MLPETRTECVIQRFLVDLSGVEIKIGRDRSPVQSHDSSNDIHLLNALVRFRLGRRLSFL